jgi:hypothetical protein
MLTRARRAAGLDFHVFTTLVLRTWQILAGGVMIFFVPFWLTKVQQGYYFFELGLNFVVTQIAGHEMAHLSWSQDGLLMGESRHLDRLASLVRMLRRWYGRASVLFFLIVGTAGLAFFLRSGDLPYRSWIGPWILLALASAANLYFSPLLAVTEGLGHVGQVARLRVVQSGVGYPLMWIVLSLGGGLWSLSIVPLIGAAATGHWIRFRTKSLGGLDLRKVAPRSSQISWRTEILPLQWRIAISWASGYFIFQLFTPTIFAYHGAVEAGRVGLAFAIFNSIQTLGMSWVNAKNPVFASLIGANDRITLNRTFIGATSRSFVFVLAATLGVVAVAWALTGSGSPWITRVASLPVLACLAVVTTTNSLIFAAATYMRAHKEEPMLAQSVTTGLLVAAAVALTSPQSVVLPIFLYMLCSLLIGLPWAAILLRRYYR